VKKAAYILLFIWTLVLIQPAFSWAGGKSAYGSCTKSGTTEVACSKTKSKSGDSSCLPKNSSKKPCSKKKPVTPPKSQEKDNCKSDGCNPTLGCISGNFYVHYHSNILLPSWFAQNQKPVLIDDNRIFKNMNECWHPPEA
jgi:hypothetical protein